MAEEQEIWLSQDEGIAYSDSDQDFESADPAAFNLALVNQGGQEGGYHVRNKEGMLQRKTVSVINGGFRKKRPAFTVGCEARAMIHGRMSPSSDKPATLLVYELKFLSRRGTRIKDADILFEFQSRSKKQGTVGPTVVEVRPNGQSKIGETIENQASKLGLSFNVGPSIPGVDAGITTSWEQNISKDIKFHTTLTGDNPADLEWGDHFQARFTLAENESQKSGIPTQLTVVILLERENDDDFEMIPRIQVTPNFASNIASRIRCLSSTRSSDDPILYSVQEPPFDRLGSAVQIDPDNLCAVDLGSLWICSMYKLYIEDIKRSAPHQEKIRQSSQ